MAKKLYEEENIRAIANAIREELNGSTDTYTTEDMPVGVRQVSQWQYDVGYDDGVSDGKSNALPLMLPLEIQAQYKYATPTVSDGSRVFPANVFETAANSFDDFADYDVTESSLTLTLTAMNYTACYAHFYFQVNEFYSDGELGASTDVYLVCPPNTDRSSDFVLKGAYEQGEYWELALKGVRFSIYEEYVSLWE